MSQRPDVPVASYIACFPSSALAKFESMAPWEMTAGAESLVRALLTTLPNEEFTITGEIAIHRSTVVEAGAILKGPLILGAGCFVAAGAYGSSTSSGTRTGRFADPTRRRVFSPS